jgi:hypothetical protein
LYEPIAILVDGGDEFIDLIGVSQALHVQLCEDICNQNFHFFSVQSATVVCVVLLYKLDEIASNRITTYLKRILFIKQFEC